MRMLTYGKLRFEIPVEAAVDPFRTRKTCEETGRSIKMMSDPVTDVLRRANSPPDYMDLWISFGPRGVLP